MKGVGKGGAVPPATIPLMPTSVVTGGAGFLGSHLCEYLIERGHRVICVDNLVTSSLVNIEHLRGDSFRIREPRPDRASRGRRAGRLRLPLRSARKPGRLPPHAAALAQGSARRARTTRSVWRSSSAHAFSSLRRARSTAIRRSTRNPRPTGVTSTRSARAACTTRGEAVRRGP